MRNFQFRLDRVLDWYRNQYQIERARLAEAMAALGAARQRVARFHAECVAVERDIVGRKEIAGRDFSALGLFRLRAKKTEAELGQGLKARESALRGQMQKVQDAQRRLRLLEKLRERRLSEHQYLENKELEDLAAEAFLAKWDGPGALAGASRHPNSISPMAPTGHDGSRP